MLLVDVEIVGKPEPQGSAQAFVPLHPKTKQPYRRAGGGIVVNVTTDNPALKSWRKQVGDAAREAYGAEPVVGVGVVVELVSYLARPLAHYGTGRNAGTVKTSAPAYPIVRPDGDKLLRGVLDALTCVVWHDDSQVTDAVTRKRYAESPDRVRASVRVSLASQQTVADSIAQLALVG